MCVCVCVLGGLKAGVCECVFDVCVLSYTCFGCLCIVYVHTLVYVLCDIHNAYKDRNIAHISTYTRASTHAGTHARARTHTHTHTHTHTTQKKENIGPPPLNQSSRQATRCGPKKESSSLCGTVFLCVPPVCLCTHTHTRIHTLILILLPMWTVFLFVPPYACGYGCVYTNLSPTQRKFCLVRFARKI